MIRLYGDRLRISPFVFSVYATLKEKELEFEYRGLALEEGETESESFVRLSPSRLVPLLQVDDFAVSEATAVIEYLEERFPGAKSMFPRDPKDRAKARMLCAWLRSSIQTLRDERSAETIFYPETRSGKRLSEYAKYQAQVLCELTERFLDASGGENLFSERSIADYDLTYAVLRLLSNGDPVPKRVQDYVQAQIETPLWKEHFAFQRGPFTSYV